ncbi:hypothetical protein [Halolamina sp.]|jgi:hypothetical protein|uniref:hypothetical protein n=1 Tax=Halolamina sp. TaxID=1940283 RepID=UPI000223B8D5|nr:hypothetical protein Halar_1780 [halophilic archaeon DL31]
MDESVEPTRATTPDDTARRERTDPVDAATHDSPDRADTDMRLEELADCNAEDRKETDDQPAKESSDRGDHR